MYCSLGNRVEMDREGVEGEPVRHRRPGLESGRGTARPRLRQVLKLLDLGQDPAETIDLSRNTRWASWQLGLHGRDMSKPSDLVQGTLDLLILKILALEPLHGWAISQRLKQVSSEVLQVSDGSLYPALHKLEQEGWITAEWKPSASPRVTKASRASGVAVFPRVGR